jgi:hypothetical protein
VWGCARAKFTYRQYRQIGSPWLDGEVGLQHSVQLLGDRRLGRHDLVDLGDERAEEGGRAEEEEDAVHLHAAQTSCAQRFVADTLLRDNYAGILSMAATAAWTL